MVRCKAPEYACLVSHTGRNSFSYYTQLITKCPVEISGGEPSLRDPQGTFKNQVLKPDAWSGRDGLTQSVVVFITLADYVLNINGGIN
jgi:hypothetical protein